MKFLTLFLFSLILFISCTKKRNNGELVEHSKCINEDCRTTMVLVLHPELKRHIPENKRKCNCLEYEYSLYQYDSLNDKLIYIKTYKK